MASSAKRILLVEPSPKLAESLRRRAAGEDRIRVIERAITDQAALNQLNEYNLPEAASLYQPTGLRKLFPGLRIVAQHPVTTQTLEDLLSQHSIEAGTNLLVIEAPGAEMAIVRSLINSHWLGVWSDIWLTAPEDVYYEGASGAETILAELQRHGYDLKAEKAQNPDWPQWRLSCNPMARQLQALDLEKQALTDALQQSKNELDDTQASLTTTKDELAEARKEFDREQGAWQTQKQELTKRLEGAMQHSREADSTVANLQEREVELGAALNQANAMARQLREQLDAKKQDFGELEKQLQQARDGKKAVEHKSQDQEQKIQQLQAQRDELKQESDAHKQHAEAAQSEREQAEAKQRNAENRANQLAEQVKKLEEQLAASNKNQQQFTELQKRMEHLFDQQGLQLEQAANALGRHVTSTAQNTAKELEAGFQLQQQLGSDFASLAERGNRLPSTVALQLSRQLKAQPYDLVIEMGSGVTTSFLAHTLRKRAESQSDEGSESTSVARYVEPSDDDLPKRILCFEHNRSTVNSLQNTLKQSGLTPIITLQYAPLVACQHQGKEYLYYDCGNRLRQIAQLFENRTARVFILLNDVAGDSRPDPIAALPQLLQYLSAHSLDIVVNTAKADANLINHWHQLLDARGLEYQPATEFGHQAVQLLKVNP